MIRLKTFLNSTQEIQNSNKMFRAPGSFLSKGISGSLIEYFPLLRKEPVAQKVLFEFCFILCNIQKIFQTNQVNLLLFLSLKNYVKICKYFNFNTEMETPIFLFPL